MPYSDTVGDKDIYRILVEQTKDYAVFVLDREGRVMTWNLGAERLKGYRSRGDHTASTGARSFAPEDVARGWPAHELGIAGMERAASRTRDGACARTARGSGRMS